MPRKKGNKVVLAARVSEAEFTALENLAARYQVTMTELLRQWLRTLKTYHPAPLKGLYGKRNKKAGRPRVCKTQEPPLTRPRGISSWTGFLTIPSSNLILDPATLAKL